MAVEPDPDHPTGRALCSKGRAAPELVHSSHRLLYPMRRTRSKGDPDPGWERIGWDEALDVTAAALRHLAATYGPECVAFALTSPSATAISDALPWIERLMHAFGSPNACVASELCNWHKDHATRHTFGVGIPVPDYDKTGCILLWGFSPRTSWLSQAIAVIEAQRRGARLIVVDPRGDGFASRADLWLRVRPGTDGALALGIAGVMIEEGWFDRTFVREWTNGPLLVREDTGRLLTERDLSGGGRDDCYVAWDGAAASPTIYDPTSRSYHGDVSHLSLSGTCSVETLAGRVACRPAFDGYRSRCRQFAPDVVERLTGVPKDQVRRAARLLFESRPVSYYCWTGLEQHANATQTNRAVALLYALTGDFDAPGGNVQFDKVATRDVSGADLMPSSQRVKALGLQNRPLGPARRGWVTADDLYTAILDGRPYAVRGLVGLGANLLSSRADPECGASALRRLDFCVYADLFMTPTMAYADIVMPVASAWEREGLCVGFEVGQRAESLVQLRPPAVAPQGEARSDTWIVFQLAQRLGLGRHFWDGDIGAAYRYLLEPSGVTLDALRASPSGISLPLITRYRKYAQQDSGFQTRTGKVEIYSQELQEHGIDPLPDFRDPAPDLVAQPGSVDAYPLILTCAKLPQFCHSQHRSLPSLRRHVREPGVEVHPSTATARGIEDGERVLLETPDGQMSARVRVRKWLEPGVVFAQYGWWQACPELHLPGYALTGADSANYNALIGHRRLDPVSGAVAMRSSRCQMRKSETPLSPKMEAAP